MNGSRKQHLKPLLIFLAVGFVYFIWIRLTGLAVPCIFRKITGWLCPGCGITTLIMSAARLDFAGAYHANPFLFVTSPFLLAELAYEYWLRIKGRELPRWNLVLLILYLAALCIFGILRNLNLHFTETLFL